MGLHEEVTNRILLQPEQGTAPWVKPWAVPLPYNAATSRRYNGVNVLLLWDTPYQRPAWLTFKQAQALNAHVRKGERATQIVYAATRATTEDDKEKQIPLRYRIAARAARTACGQSIASAQAALAAPAFGSKPQAIAQSAGAPGEPSLG